jgi:hypothetical protein
MTFQSLLSNDLLWSGKKIRATIHPDSYEQPLLYQLRSSKPTFRSVGYCVNSDKFHTPSIP